jgi:hypothetical protein
MASEKPVQVVSLIHHNPTVVVVALRRSVTAEVAAERMDFFATLERDEGMAVFPDDRHPPRPGELPVPIEAHVG